MLIHRLPYTEWRKLCGILDENNKWEELGGTHMEYDVFTLQDLRRELDYGNSPTNKLLVLWGLQDHTVLELFALLYRMRHYQAMTIIKKFIDPEFHCKIEDGQHIPPELFEERGGNRGYSLNSDVGRSRKISENCGYVENKEVIENVNGDVDDKRIFNVKHIPPPLVDDATLQSPTIIKPSSPLPLEKLLTGTALTHSAISCVAQSAGPIPQIPYEDLQRSTNNWDSNTILGKGGYGTVFKGTWKCTKVAIKRIESKEVNPESHMEQIKQSITELYCLNAYRHDNILPVYGYSISGPRPCLVYQYMSGGSLDERLRIRDPTKVLNWNSRLSIAIGTARGLQYLHTIGEKPLIHGDIKSANILLDPNDTPRIGDFGLAKEGPHQNITHITLRRIYGTRPYLPDEFVFAHEFSTKVDTYSFGVVLFEIATSLFAYSENLEHKFLKDHVVKYKGDVADLMDRRAGNGVDICKALIDIGKQCVNKQREDRPEMVNVLTSLESVS